jgi:hypothetical protein
MERHISTAGVSARRGLTAVAAILACLALLLATPGTAQAGNGRGHGHHGGGGGGSTIRGPGNDPANGVQVVAQAQPDECFLGIGVKPGTVTPAGTCPGGGKQRTNAGYIWGFTKDTAERNLWFGTASNAICAYLPGLTTSLEAAGLHGVTPFDSTYLTCEYDKSWDAQQQEPWTGGGAIGDVRRAHFYQYDVKTGKLVDRSPSDAVDPEWSKIGGIRAAGHHGNIVWAAGIESEATSGAQPEGVVHIAAFRASDGAFLGDQAFPQYNQVKNFYTTSAGQTFVGMGLAESEPGGSGGGPTSGVILRFTGNESNPMQFETVGRIKNQPSYFFEYEGRLVTSTWLGTDSTENPGLYISPRLHGRSQLSAGDKNNWKLVWDTGNLFPDPITAIGEQSHDIREYGGWLYYAFAPNIGASTLSHMATYPQLQSDRLVRVGTNYLRSEPASTVIRVKNLGKRNQKAQLLYGDAAYWTFHPELGARGRWRLDPNLMTGRRGIYGKAGFGNKWSKYGGWGMAEFKGKLYLGGVNLADTMRDILLDPQSHFVSDVLGRPVSSAELGALSRLLFPDPGDDEGAGIVNVFPNAHSPAKQITDSGFNNVATYGFRGLIPIGKSLYIGSNGSSNYPAAGTMSPAPRRAGWQLLKLTPSGGGHSHR